MVEEKIGISDIAVYIPTPCLDLEQLVAVRSQGKPELERRLRRAVDTTGQKFIRYPEVWEDAASMAANSALKLLERNNGNGQHILRYLAAGTETGVDSSKPLSAYVQGMLEGAGFELGHRFSSFQVQHACAGGTIAMLSVASMLKQSGRPNDRGLVLCSDIARYESNTTAEITQGAGSVALMIEKNPRLLELDLSCVGYASSDVDDFFRPIGSTTAKVKGQYSMKCYHDAAEEALKDYCDRRGKSAYQVLAESDYYIFHVPFAKMAYTAARHLLSAFMGLVDGEIDDYLKPRGFFESLDATSKVGNIYTGATYLNLASLLLDRYKKIGKEIIGKKILISSYGSGNTMLVFQATVAAGAVDVIAKWDLEKTINAGQKKEFSHYQAWIDKDWSALNSDSQSSDLPKDTFYLKNVREDGYREYSIQR